MSFLTAALAGFAGYNRGKANAQQQTLQNQYEQSQIDLDRSWQTAEERKARIDAAAQGYNYETGEPIPLQGEYEPPPKNATYEQIADWAARNYATALSRNDQAGIQQFGQAATKIPGGYGALTRADYTAGALTNNTNAKTALYKAQADYWRNWRTREQMTLDAAMARVNAQQGGAMRRAQLSASTRAEIAGRSLDERMAIANMTAVNMANRMSYEEAFRAALDEANRQDAINMNTYNRTFEAAAAHGAAGATAGETAAGPPPQVIEVGGAQGATPSTIVVNLQMPDGRIVQKTIANPAAKQAAAPPKHLLPIQTQINEAYRKGVFDPGAIRASLKAAGYPQATIDRVLPNVNLGAPGTPGGFLRPFSTSNTPPPNP